MTQEQREHTFHYRLQRSRTRESSTLTIATVASSASLVLLVLYIQVQIEVEIDMDKLLIPVRYIALISGVGIFSAVAGIAYRDTTALTIHRTDECYLRKNTLECGDKTRTWGRTLILHFLLLTPIIAWLTVLNPTYISNEILYSLIILIIFYIAIISVYEDTDPCHSPKEAFNKLFARLRHIRK